MFRFKRFDVDDSGCAMKVGTDGILLGAWAAADNATRILDVGCGSGLISLMMAQRFSTALIVGVDVDHSAWQQASVNFQRSCWKDRLSAHCADVRHFQSAAYAAHAGPFDVVVSNPPWFRNSYRSDSPARNLARHVDQLGFCELLHAVQSLLSSDGSFSLILPEIDAPLFLANAEESGFFCHRRCTVFPRRDLRPGRALLELRQHRPSRRVDISSLVVENSQRHDYTAEFRELTKDFYLRF